MDFNNQYNDNAMNRSKDLVLAINEYVLIQDKTDGKIRTCCGPKMVTISQQQALVVFNSKTKKFDEVNDFNRAKQLFVSAPEGWYVILKNPTESGKHPDEGINNPPSDMRVGVKVNVPGPTSFALFPGQMAKVVRGHKLRSNQYLIARVYDAAAATENAASSIMLDAEGKEVQTKTAYFAGQLLVIKGTEVSFYVPPTGVEVVACEDNPFEYVRDAVTLERLEYCILKDENGSKSYYHGPAVVFPKPTETFVQTPQKTVIFRAIELSEISGIYIKVIADYEEDGVKHPIGEELFITGATQKIYYPRPEHAMIQYDGKYMHHAIAIPEGEGRYILDRIKGTIQTIKGPAMYLPDPRTEVVVKRVLSPKECEAFYPGNKEVLQYNLGLDEAQAERAAKLGKSNKTDVVNNAYSTSNQEATLAIFAATANISRGTSYTKPRTIVLDTKYEGVVGINVWSGYAVNVVAKDGTRETVVGPATRLLDYDETLEIVNLSTGKPKTTDKLLSTAYLKVNNNKVTDVISVQTKDFVEVKLALSYNVNFLPEHKAKWFAVDNYVKHLCDRQRNLIKAEAKKYGIEDFYAQAAEIVSNIALDKKTSGDTEGKDRYNGRFFKENGMLVTEVEVIAVQVEDKVAKMMERRQTEAIMRTIELSDATKKADMVKQLIEFEREEAELKHAKDMYILDLRFKEDAERLAQQYEAAELKRAEELAVVQAKSDMQDVLDAIHKAQLARDRAADDQKIATEKALAAIEEAKQKAYAETVAKIYGAISPDLVAAMEAKANAELTAGIGAAVAPYAIAGNESVSQAVTRLLKGTSLEETLNKLGTFNVNN